LDQISCEKCNYLAIERIKYCRTNNNTNAERKDIYYSYITWFLTLSHKTLVLHGFFHARNPRYFRPAQHHEHIQNTPSLPLEGSRDPSTDYGPTTTLCTLAHHPEFGRTFHKKMLRLHETRPQKSRTAHGPAAWAMAWPAPSNPYINPAHLA
jgi:hypothetical protein